MVDRAAPNSDTSHEGTSERTSEPDRDSLAEHAPEQSTRADPPAPLRLGGDITTIETKHPSGTVTLLFTDIEGSTRLWEQAPDAMARALRRHDELLRWAIEDSEGYVFKTVGDAFCAAFQKAKDAVRAAEMAQRALFAEAWPDGLSMRIRMGLHTGTCDERGGDYFGPTVNRTARLDAVAHGGQTVLSRTTADRVRDILPDGILLLDLGSHRLKDLGEPEHVYQLEIEGLDGQFPPLRSLDNPELGNNLPQQATSFVGRETQMAEVRSLFETTRLVTLVGAGGVGKSRLAIQLAAELLDGTGNGVWLVEFAPLSDPDFVPQALASVLSVRQEPGRAVVDTLLDVLRGRNLLLVLDNCEHLIGACAKMADALLRSCPGVTLMATSREPLGIDGEQVFRVPSLSLPPIDGVQASEDLGSSEAVQLFVARAVAHDPTFIHEGANQEAVASICRRLDGIPLALELAASRLGALSVAHIEARLDNRFRLLTTGSRRALPRQQTLRALVDWSYDLLREPEQVVLSRSSVFAGSFTLESVETVCAGGVIHSAHVMDLLTSLVDKSLIQADTSGSAVRYRLLETIRQYAGEKLAEHGEVETIRLGHALAYLGFAEEAALHLSDLTQAEWLDRIGQDRDNLRVAAACLLADSDSAKEALRLVIALQRFWDIRGPMGEAIDTVDAALALSGDDGPTPLRTEAMAVAAEFKFDSGLVAQARIQAEDGLVMARQIGDPKLTAKLLCLVAFATFKQGNRTPDVFKYADEAVSLARKTGDFDLTGEALLTRHALIDDSDPSRARADAAEALSKFRVTGNQRLIVVILNNLASGDMSDGDFATARSHLEEALVVATGIGDQRMFPSLLFNSGLVACLEGDHRTGKNSFTDALTRAESVGDRSMLALALLGLALCATTEGDEMRAAAMHGAAQVLIENNGEVLEPLEARAAEEDYHRLRDRIGLEAFEAAFDNGRQLTVESAVALAMKGSCGP